LHPPADLKKSFFCDRAFVVLQIFREQILFDQHQDQRDFVCLDHQTNTPCAHSALVRSMRSGSAMVNYYSI